MKAGIDLAALRRSVGGARARHHRLAAQPPTCKPGATTLRSFENQRQQAQADIWWCNISGGTDFAGAFIGGNRELPQVPGEMQCRLLGCAVEAWNEQGQPVIDEVGELVCTAADAVDAALLLERRGQRALSLQLLRHLPRRLAPRRLAQDHAGRRLHHLRPQRCHHQPPRPAHGHQRALQRGRSAARGAGLAWSSTSNTSAATATCRCSWCCARASRSTTR